MRKILTYGAIAMALLSRWLSLACTAPPFAGSSVVRAPARAQDVCAEGRWFESIPASLTGR